MAVTRFLLTWMPLAAKTTRIFFRAETLITVIEDLLNF